MPAVQELMRKMLGKQPMPISGLDPDEAVAKGRCSTGRRSELSDVEGVLLLDVTPLSLGIETVGGIVSHVIERNTTLPTQAKQVFTTSADGQTVVNIRVYPGLAKREETASPEQTSGQFPTFRYSKGAKGHTPD